METLALNEATRIEIISLMDNSIDFLSSNNKKEAQPLRQWTKDRFGEDWAQKHTELPIAEHGFSMLIRVFRAETPWSILFDTGISSEGAVVNAERMGLDLSEVDCVVLSHGHYDHFGGLQAAVEAINKPKLEIITHEDMFKDRGTANPQGTIQKHPSFPTKQQLSPAKTINTKQPYLIANGSVCVTGEIPRKTSFETGYAQNRILVDNIWQADPWILDDRALIVNLKNKGLVIISGCAHAGIINTIRYSQQITRLTSVYAVVGGFHLAGKENEKRIKPTIEALKQINPKLIIPCHCSGWRANVALAQEFSHAYIHNSVGNLYHLKSSTD
ncbi:MAG: MBL fold metallo-hydrolase [Chloroflexi bacterium]|nr:MBL fold metallo-hydrolase [Chloroflexota bacterium]